MKAVRIYEYGGPEILKFELDAPEPTIDADTGLIEAAGKFAPVPGRRFFR